MVPTEISMYSNDNWKLIIIYVIITRKADLFKGPVQ